MKKLKIFIIIVAAIFIARLVQTLYNQTISTTEKIENLVSEKNEEINSLEHRLNQTKNDYDTLLENFRNLELACVTPEVLKTAKGNAESHTYDVDYYNCKDFSKSLATRHQNMGYISGIVNGWYITDKSCTDDSSCQQQFSREYEVRCIDMRCEFRHTWTETVTPFEAVGGYIVPPSDLWRYKRDT